jgi:hypothetical protein
MRNGCKIRREGSPMKQIPLLLVIFCLALTACDGNAPAPTDVPTATTTVTATAPQNEPSLPNSMPGITSQATTEPVASVSPTDIASLIKVFIANVMDQNVDLTVDARTAVSPVGGVATVQYPGGGVHPLYVCITPEHANVLDNLVLAATANVQKMISPASQTTVGDWRCNVYTANPYNASPNGTLIAGTPTALTTPLFSLVLNFIPVQNNGGGSGSGDGDGGNGGYPPGTKPDGLGGCVDDGID